MGERFALEYMFPAFVLPALVGSWRVIRRFASRPIDPQLTLLGLVVGSTVMILVFFNVFFRHDYYALPLVPIYCVLTSIGLFYLYSLLCPPIARYPKSYAALAILAIFGSLYYGYSLRSLNYEENKASIAIGKSLQELVPANGYVFYCDKQDLANPEFLYYVRRRGLTANINTTDNEFVGQVMRDHHWDPDNTYLLANEVRLQPAVAERLKARLSNYDVREIGTSLNNGIVYKLVPKG
jgi:hypothetical protein